MTYSEKIQELDRLNLDIRAHVDFAKHEESAFWASVECLAKQHLDSAQANMRIAMSYAEDARKLIDELKKEQGA